MISDYNTFKAEIRKLELEFQNTKSKKKQYQSTNVKPETSEFAGLKSLLPENARIEVLEKQKEFQTNAIQQYPQNRSGNPGDVPMTTYTRGAERGYHVIGQRGPRHNRGARGQFQGRRPYRGQGRGTNSYRPTRPIAGTTFRPHIQCYNCNEHGHYASECPLNG
jgi:hypothetical protein